MTPVVVGVVAVPNPIRTDGKTVEALSNVTCNAVTTIFRPVATVTSAVLDTAVVMLACLMLTMLGDRQ